MVTCHDADAILRAMHMSDNDMAIALLHAVSLTAATVISFQFPCASFKEWLSRSFEMHVSYYKSSQHNARHPVPRNRPFSCLVTALTCSARL